jgi:predicted dehydrogenase
VYRVGLIGCGRMGAEHARAYAAVPQTRLVALADPHAGRLHALGDRFGVPVASRYTRYEDLLATEKLDIAGVVVPVSASPRIVLACAAAGVRAIFCEKPIAASLREADEMVEACRARGIPLACGAIWRNHPYLQTARRLLVEGAIGRVLGIASRHASGEISGGGCHSLGVVRLLAGDPGVSWVVGWMAGDPCSEQDQGAGGYLRFANGVECFLTDQAGAKSGVELVGERGVLLWDWRNVYLWQRPTSEVEDGSHDLHPVPFPYPPLLVPDVYPGITGGILSLMECLERGGEPLCSGHDMRQALEIAIALRESHRRGHVPVHLPIADRAQRIVPNSYRWLGGEPQAQS